MTLLDKQALDEAAKLIEEIRAARSDGRVTIHVSREGRAVSVEVQRTKALPICN